MQKRSILTWLATSYVAFIVVWALLRALFFDRFWPLALLNTVAQYLFVPLPLLLIIAVWQRHQPSLLKLTVPILAFVVLFGELFLPPLSRPVADNTPSITVMSFNVLYTNSAYEAVVASVQAASPDLIGFQGYFFGPKQLIIKANLAVVPLSKTCRV